ncbi:hypothetical protein CcCBS67573_g07185 [Chytriomyces confervae]|uniref:Uncharacterized protein n=1 Tax=Chytriomyces confervae TaxID=246404 RepID=A0A507EYK9_9FUNG|nr:hypothetical protein CcCBS67573_g07185 [Chytriomyces confervae]
MFRIHKERANLFATEVCNEDDAPPKAAKTEFSSEKKGKAPVKVLMFSARDSVSGLNLTEGILKEVQAIQLESIAEFLEAQRAAVWHDRELRTETASSDAANDELSDFSVSSYALREVDVGNAKNESFVGRSSNEEAYTEQSA